MCLAELIAGVWGTAFSGDILKKADVSHRTESSLVEEVETDTSGMGKAGNGTSREENE